MGWAETASGTSSYPRLTLPPVLESARIWREAMAKKGKGGKNIKKPKQDKAKKGAGPK